MKLSGYEPKNGPEMDPKMDQKNLKILAKSKNGPIKWTNGLKMDQKNSKKWTKKSKNSSKIL